MKEIQISLTFDYEPFLFKTGNIETTLLNPTTQLLRKLSNNRICATFFIDTMFLVRVLEDLGSNSKLWIKISEQICEIHNSGHEIGLHLHPHWLDAKYQNREWDLSNTSKYRLHSLRHDEIEYLIKQSIEVIHNIIGKKIWSELISYRAGGWSIQPFSYLSDLFTKYNILIDSSVSSGFSNNSSPFDYDFLKIKMHEPYRFSNDVCVESKNGKFLEVPITSCSYNFVMKFINRLDKYLHSEIYNTFGKGNSIQSFKKSGLNKIFKYFTTDKIMLSIDRMQPMLFKYLVTNINEDNIVIISHPKDYSKSSGRCLDKLNNIKGLRHTKLSELR
jgi:peptidoglycan/xylan/chitin deacetylase (PgdA/CDA1 family)